MPVLTQPASEMMDDLCGRPGRRRILFQSRNMDVDMKVDRAGDAWSIIGQISSVAGKFVPTLSVHLRQGLEQVQTVRTNLVGEFVFDRVPAAVFVLEIELPDGRIMGGFDLDSSYNA
jgi:hypothetical protein